MLNKIKNNAIKKSKIKHFVHIPRWHLKPDTLKNYIETRTYELPLDVYGGTLSDGNDVIRLYRDEHLTANDTFDSTEPPIPDDLLTLLNWAIDNNIEIIQLESDDISPYGSWEHLQDVASITGLPLYDITKKHFR